MIFIGVSLVTFSISAFVVGCNLPQIIISCNTMEGHMKAPRYTSFEVGAVTIWEIT